ncbi:MAG: PadR family transcriptional regulator [Fimbriimonas sp.]|nr:PadR family transcriptional regulator [Fimbriimonas sp.]
MAFKGDLEAMVLGVLQDGDLHGYEISKRIKQTGAKALQVWEGQLYPTLHNLEKDGFVSAIWVPHEGKPPRKVYALTDEGRRELSAHRMKWKEFSQSVEALLSPRHPASGGAK